MDGLAAEVNVESCHGKLRLEQTLAVIKSGSVGEGHGSKVVAGHPVDTVGVVLEIFGQVCGRYVVVVATAWRSRGTIVASVFKEIDESINEDLSLSSRSKAVASAGSGR